MLAFIVIITSPAINTLVFNLFMHAEFFSGFYSASFTEFTIIFISPMLAVIIIVAFSTFSTLVFILLMFTEFSGGFYFWHN
jgi:hypothetical protein